MAADEFSARIILEFSFPLRHIEDMISGLYGAVASQGNLQLSR
jgi:hypothetical protein